MFIISDATENEMDLILNVDLRYYEELIETCDMRQTLE